MKHSWWTLMLALVATLTLVAVAENVDDADAAPKKKRPVAAKTRKPPELKPVTLTGTIMQEAFTRKDRKTGKTVNGKRLVLKTDDGKKALLPGVGLLRQTSPDFKGKLTDFVDQTVTIVGKGHIANNGVVYVREISSVTPAEEGGEELDEAKPLGDDDDDKVGDDDDDDL